MPRPRVVVVGGGPGGSTAARSAACRGHRVAQLVKETFPIDASPAARHITGQVPNVNGGAHRTR
ncbi:hypothetical protein ETD83_02920 [Actinomadura soli]|uniref:Uncharacterized protein n=1 Tax=Actinomadura soli TaxID=2508997 RepID=A0A5C4JJ68_9ACTN|nr:hypothetical protein ETD83_02920 [Actinomadura soli]